MKFYKDDKNEVFAFEADGSQDSFIPEGAVSITEEEADAIRFPPPTKEQKENEIRSRYAAMMDAIVKPYLPVERETWFSQLKEADDWLLNPLSATPMLSAIATGRGITLSALVDKVKGNDTLFRAAVGSLLGKQQAELDALG